MSIISCTSPSASLSILPTSICTSRARSALWVRSSAANWRISSPRSGAGVVRHDAEGRLRPGDGLVDRRVAGDAAEDVPVIGLRAACSPTAPRPGAPQARSAASARSVRVVGSEVSRPPCCHAASHLSTGGLKCRRPPDSSRRCGYGVGVSFAQQGPPASAKQVAYIQALMRKAGYDDFRSARTEYRLTQRQARGQVHQVGGVGADRSTDLDRRPTTRPSRWSRSPTRSSRRRPC